MRRKFNNVSRPMQSTSAGLHPGTSVLRGGVPTDLDHGMLIEPKYNVWKKASKDTLLEILHNGSDNPTVVKMLEEQGVDARLEVFVARLHASGSRMIDVLKELSAEDADRAVEALNRFTKES